MKIERAIREKTYTLTSIAGPSGSGKTYSALLYARGLVGSSGKIGFIDTENKRSRFYADVAGGFDVIDLEPPFTASRYIEAIKAFEAAGYKAIVIDSISHEWEGSGGVLEQAEAIEEKTKRAGLHCWQKPKAAHKKLMNELLQTRAHLVFCCRVKEKVVQVKGAGGKTEIVNEGFVVVQEKSFIYEMTVSMMLAEGTHVPLLQKCPGDLLAGFPEGSRITTKIGDAVREWSDKGEAVDEEFEAAKREGVVIASQGTTPLLAWWKALDKAKKIQLEGIKDSLKSIAQAYDQMVDDQMDAGGGDIGDRLKYARETQTGADSAEGFDREFVRDQMRDNTETKKPVSSSPRETGDAGAALASAGTDDDNPSASSSVPKLTEEQRRSLIEFGSKMMKLSKDALSPESRIGIMENRELDWREILPNVHWGKLSSIVETMTAVIKSQKTRPEGAAFISEVLECDPSEIGA